MWCSIEFIANFNSLFSLFYKSEKCWLYFLFGSSLPYLAISRYLGVVHRRSVSIYLISSLSFKLWIAHLVLSSLVVITRIASAGGGQVGGYSLSLIEAPL